MRIICIITLLVCGMTSFVLGQQGGENCAAICDASPGATCDGVPCDEWIANEIERRALPLPACPPNDPTCQAAPGDNWGPCSEKCEGGTREVTKWGKAYDIDCNTHSCTDPEGRCRLDLVFVLDASGSLSPLDWILMQQFVMDVIQGLDTDPPVHFGALTFHSITLEILPLGKHSEDEMFDKIKAADGSLGLTNTAAGLKLMREMMAASPRKGDVEQVAIVLTDGNANIPMNARAAIKDEVDAAVAEDITIFSVGFGYVDEDELKIIANNQPGFYKMVPDAAALRSITQEMVDEACELDYYDCDEKSPCTMENWHARKHYFPYKNDKHKFIHCDRETCFLKFCTPPSVFIPGQDNCGWP